MSLRSFAAWSRSNILARGRSSGVNGFIEGGVVLEQVDGHIAGGIDGGQGVRTPLLYHHFVLQLGEFNAISTHQG